jgi:hypothetical protein
VKEVKMYLIKVKAEAEGFSFLVVADSLRGLLGTLDKLFGEEVKGAFSPGGYTFQVRLPHHQVAKPVVAVLTKQKTSPATVNLPTLPFSLPVKGNG